MHLRTIALPCTPTPTLVPGVMVKYQCRMDTFHKVTHRNTKARISCKQRLSYNRILIHALHLRLAWGFRHKANRGIARCHQWDTSNRNSPILDRTAWLLEARQRRQHMLLPLIGRMSGLFLCKNVSRLVLRKNLKIAEGLITPDQPSAV